MRRILLLGLAFLLQTALSLPLFGQATPSNSDINDLEIRSVTVGEKNILLNGSEVSLGQYPETIVFRFGARTNSLHPPGRIRYKLDGSESGWLDGPGEMFLAVRFYNNVGDQISQQDFKVHGESAGWNGSCKTSPLTHRREVVVVPPQATRFLIVLSSAGPPATIGIYVVANLVVSQIVSSQPPVVLIDSPLDHQSDSDTNHVPAGWMRDGNHSTMAQIINVGQDPAQKAFAVLDDDALSHAEWHNMLVSAPRVHPGDHLLLEWNEMFSMGVADITAAHYVTLLEGKYRFQAARFDLFGRITGMPATIDVVVPPPIWRTPWFWSIVAATGVALALAVGRYVTWRRMRLEMLLLKNHQVLEEERLRIAQDIHDDLGARVTEISLASALAKTKPTFPASAGEDFDQISDMCRNLVSALYETVWAVNPENDNLNALGNYLCQMINRLCEQAQLPCRLDVSDLQHNGQVSSQIRHNLVMAVKEAVHNVIKHARATELSLAASFKDGLLTIAIHDNGCGMNSQTITPGYGLANMKRRTELVGGTCRVESQPGQGTTVTLQLALPDNNQTAA